MNIRFIGLGNMGLPMLTRLGDSGYTVSGFDVQEGARDRAREAGITVIDDASESIDAVDVLVLMLPTSRIVDAVLVEQGLLYELHKGAVIVDMGSSNPMDTRRLASIAAELGIDYVDAPVSGGVVGAVGGTLTIMVGGEVAPVERVMPMLQPMGGQVRHVGPVASGHALKALNNLLSATHLLISSEALLVGQEFGMEQQVMLDVLNTSSGRSASTEVKWPKFVIPNTYDSGFAMALMTKDMQIAVDLAQDLKWNVPLALASTQAWAAATADMPGADHTEIVKWLSAHHGEGL